MSRGRFIVVEGLDGSGKTTQARRLVSTLQATGHLARFTAEPSGLPIGKLIRQALLDPTQLGEATLPYLFAADRRDHLDREILPALARGEVLVCDRYVGSSLAYQSFSLPLEEVWALNARFPAPDLTLFIDLPLEDCAARVRARGAALERFEDMSRAASLAAAYGLSMATLQARGHKVVAVDGHGGADEVAARVWAEVLRCL